MFSPDFLSGNKTVFFSILLFFVFSVKAQMNLVPNGSFEEYNWCPDYDNGFFITACKEWTMPTLGTSDYFNSCSLIFNSSIIQFGVPQNYAGFQYAKTGIAYAGLLYFDNKGSITNEHKSYSEYIQVKLEKKLEEGRLYRLTFFVSNAFDFSCSNSIGALFSPVEIHENHDSIIQITPQFQSDLDLFFCDTTKWYQLEYIFQADGTEEFLIIGVFTELYDSQYIYNGINVTEQENFVNQYLYVDDVSLFDIDPVIPNVFTPNNDGINDLLQLRNIPNEYILKIFNRWGDIIFETLTPNQEFWDGTSKNGKLCIEGVYYYLLQDKQENKKTGFIHLIR